MSTDFDLLRYFETSLPQSLALLRQMVEIESHSLDKSGVDALAEFLAREFEARGAGIRILHEPVRGNLLECLWNAGSTEKHVLVLGHLDTVWPRGSVAARPFRLEQGRAYGPGVFDMKAGLLISPPGMRSVSKWQGEYGQQRSLSLHFRRGVGHGSRAGTSAGGSQGLSRRALSRTAAAGRQGQNVSQGGRQLSFNREGGRRTCRGGLREGGQCDPRALPIGDSTPGIDGPSAQHHGQCRDN